MSSGDERSAKPNRRAAPRIPGAVYFSSGREEGSGFIHDISVAGARVSVPSPSPRFKPDTTVDLWFSVGTDQTPVSAKGRVVRSEAEEFAVEFLRLDNRVQRILLAASAATRPTDR